MGSAIRRCRTPTRYDMGTHMKTTVELADSLLEEAKATASEHGVTLRTLIEEGLRRAVDERRRRRSRAFRLPRASFKGKGLQPDVADGSWASIRDRAYEGRGG